MIAFYTAVHVVVVGILGQYTLDFVAVGRPPVDPIYLVPGIVYKCLCFTTVALLQSSDSTTPTAKHNGGCLNSDNSSTAALLLHDSRLAALLFVVYMIFGLGR